MPAERPIHGMLTQASGRLSGHMPGHKGRAPFGAEDPYLLDTTELPVTDDLYAPEGAIARAEALYAETAGSGKTLFLTGGASAGITVMLLLWARHGCAGRPGDVVLLPRNAHHSAVDACINFGLRPVWIPVRQRENGKIFVAEEDVLAALREHPEAKTLLLTRPDYDGVCIPLRRIADEARRQGTRLVIDEAHGAHFPWMDQPCSAGTFGADAWVQSAHKTLPALTGSAVLHLRSAEDGPRARHLLRRTQSSSPSFILLQSIDDARAWMQLHGRERLRALSEAVAALRDGLPALGYADGTGLMAEEGYTFDPTRLVIEAPQGGFALERELRRQGLDAEKADRTSVTLILTAANTKEDISRIAGVLRRVPAHREALPPAVPLATLPGRVCDPWEADALPCEAVPITEAPGRVSAVSVGLYPPGIPLVVPGERIPPEAARLVAQAPARGRFGLEEDRWLCVQTAP